MLSLAGQGVYSTSQNQVLVEFSIPEIEAWHPKDIVTVLCGLPVTDDIYTSTLIILSRFID